MFNEDNGYAYSITHMYCVICYESHLVVHDWRITQHTISFLTRLYYSFHISHTCYSFSGSNGVPTLL